MRKCQLSLRKFNRFKFIDVRALNIGFVLIICLISLVGCNHSATNFDEKVIDLNNLIPIEDPIDTKIKPLRVAIAAIISPESTVENYKLLLNYLEIKLGRPIELIQRRTYAETNDLLMSGEVDLAFVCTNAYVVGRREFNMQLLVIPKINGETNYYSQLIVPIESQAQSILDLAGENFAFTDPMSFSGRIYPSFHLYQLGENPLEFFSNTFYTYSHEDAIKAVENGLAAGANVDSLVLDFAFAGDSSLKNRIKVIHTSPPFGIPPIVVGPNISSQLRDLLLEIFLNMNSDPDGIEALHALDIDEFVLASEEEYNSVEDIEIIVANKMELP